MDWFVGYGPPPENFQAKLEKVIKGEDTFKAVNDAYAKNPNDAALAFKLARKWSDRFDEVKPIELYKKVIALDPEGKSGNYTNEYTKVTVPYTVMAEYSLATTMPRTAKPDMGPIKAFIAKYPSSPMVKSAYSSMANYYGRQASKDEAAAAFAEYAAKYPDDPYALQAWLNRIVMDKGPYDKGLELAETIERLTQRNQDPYLQQSLGDFYLAKGDKAKAATAFGKEYADGQVQSLGYNLISYAEFWLGKNENLDSARAMAETALKLEPENAYFIQQAAALYVKMNLEDKAMALFGPKWAEAKMTDASALYSYSSFWARQGKNLDSALAAAKKAVALKPAQYYQWANLGDILGKTGAKTEAIKAYQKAIELAPDQVKPMYKPALDKLLAPEKK
ncbi:MAG: tetratricopeptide repeat protein [Candidatus Aminicenantes bacterium]|nr:tetratricopeptide repeat protein [Candidatus Aminicenantes bacterium]